MLWVKIFYAHAHTYVPARPRIKEVLLAHCANVGLYDLSTVTALACFGVERGMQPCLLLVLDPESVVRVENRNTAKLAGIGIGSAIMKRKSVRSIP